ncbi:DUF434 domain-containing protein [Pseudomonas sp. AN3A02]|nr:DUF434 domain-containing protein [Pseudomonas sp. AN3A02]
MECGASARLRAIGFAKGPALALIASRYQLQRTSRQLLRSVVTQPYMASRPPVRVY